MNKDRHRIKILENSLETLLLKYSQLQSGNRDLRFEIDVMRKEHRNLQRANASLIKDITSISDEARRINQQTHQGQRITEETNN